MCCLCDTSTNVAITIGLWHMILRVMIYIVGIFVFVHHTSLELGQNDSEITLRNMGKSIAQIH